jgi:hypothetical protein
MRPVHERVQKEIDDSRFSKRTPRQQLSCHVVDAMAVAKKGLLSTSVVTNNPFVQKLHERRRAREINPY